MDFYTVYNVGICFKPAFSQFGKRQEVSGSNNLNAAQYAGAKKLGKGFDYQPPLHNSPQTFIAQDYMAKEFKKTCCQPTYRSTEQQIQSWMAKLRQILDNPG